MMIIKSLIEKIKSYVLKYKGEFLVGVICAIFLVFVYNVITKDVNSYSQEYVTNLEASYKTQIEELIKIREEEKLRNEKAIADYNNQIAIIEKKYTEQIEQLEKNKKVVANNIVINYSDNPTKLASLLSEASKGNIKVKE